MKTRTIIIDYVFNDVPGIIDMEVPENSADSAIESLVLEELHSMLDWDWRYEHEAAS